MRVSKWFNRQPNQIKAALIVAMATLIAAVLTFVASALNQYESLPKRYARFEQIPPTPKSTLQFKPYKKKRSTTETAGVSIVAFTLDSRHTHLECVTTPGADYEFEVVGGSWPVLLVAFYNANDKPVVFTGIEVVHRRVGGVFLKAGVGLEPFAAVDVHIGAGLQSFLPPILLHSKEAGAIHIRLKENSKIKEIPFGLYKFKFHVGRDIIESPSFLWLQGH